MLWRAVVVLIGASFSYAAGASLSYQAAETKLLATGGDVLAAQVLAQAAEAKAAAVANLGLPSVSISAQAVAMEHKANLPLAPLQHAQSQLSELTGINTAHALPDHLSLTAQRQHIGGTLSVSMPLYTGGAIDSIKTLAVLNQDRATLDLMSQTSLAKLNLIHHYFDTQLKAALLANEQRRYKAMTHHSDNAQKLYDQGFISKAVLLQFQVAQNQALRLYQAADNAHKSSLFTLQTLLQAPSIHALSTPLFINPNYSISWQTLQKDSQQSPLRQKLAVATNISEQQTRLAQSRTKPTVFAVGQKSLQDKDWFLGVVARYELFSGVDHKQNLYASEQTQNASVFANQKATQELDSAMHTAYVQFTGAKTSEHLLQHNLGMAQQNLHLQTLAFKEGVGTVSGVVDAEAAIAQIQSERAINAYRYIMALATLLHSVDRLDNFAQYASLFDTITIDL